MTPLETLAMIGEIFSWIGLEMCIRDSFLLWVGIVLLILAVIAWLLRSLTGRRR